MHCSSGAGAAPFIRPPARPVHKESEVIVNIVVVAAGWLPPFIRPPARPVQNESEVIVNIVV